MLINKSFLQDNQGGPGPDVGHGRYLGVLAAAPGGQAHDEVQLRELHRVLPQAGVDTLLALVAASRLPLEERRRNLQQWAGIQSLPCCSPNSFWDRITAKFPFPKKAIHAIHSSTPTPVPAEKGALSSVAGVLARPSRFRPSAQRGKHSTPRVSLNMAG